MTKKRLVIRDHTLLNQHKLSVEGSTRNEKEKAQVQHQMRGTDHFVFLQVESLQFRTSPGQSHHALIRDAIALT